MCTIFGVQRAVNEQELFYCLWLSPSSLSHYFIKMSLLCSNDKTRFKVCFKRDLFVPEKQQAWPLTSSVWSTLVLFSWISVKTTSFDQSIQTFRTSQSLLNSHNCQCSPIFTTQLSVTLKCLLALLSSDERKQSVVSNSNTPGITAVWRLLYHSTSCLLWSDVFSLVFCPFLLWCLFLTVSDV